MSGHIPRPFIDELLARCELVDIIDSRLTLRKTGSNYVACCPFHNEKSPSFTVSSTKQFYHCFGCGANGNAISFVMAFDNLEFVSAVEALAAQLGMTIPYEDNTDKSLAPTPDLYRVLEHAADYYQQQLQASASAVDYLKQRELNRQVAKVFDIGYAPAGWENIVKVKGIGTNEQLLAAGLVTTKGQGKYYDRFRNRIMFPIRDQRGRVIGFGGRVIDKNDTPKYLNSPETAVFHKGKELYGLYEALQANRQPPRILVVEGYMDVVMLAQHDIDYAVATLGTATTTEHIRRLLRVTSEIIFCFDADSAGKKAARRALETCLPLLQDAPQIKFLLLPEGEDPDSQVAKEGKANFIKRLERAMPLTDFLFEQVESGIDLTSLTGRAKFAKKAGSLIAKIPTGIFQHMLLERLAVIVQVDLNHLPSLLDISEEETIIAALPQRVSSSLMRRAIALLIQEPAKLSKAEIAMEQLAEITQPGVDLLKRLYSLILEQPGISTAMLIEHWRGKEEQTQLAKLISWPLNIPEEGIAAEFEEIIKRLQRREQELLIEHLYSKAQLQQLSDDEKRTLQALIAKSKA